MNKIPPHDQLKAFLQNLNKTHANRPDEEIDPIIDRVCEDVAIIGFSAGNLRVFLENQGVNTDFIDDEILAENERIDQLSICEQILGGHSITLQDLCINCGYHVVFITQRIYLLNARK